MPLYDLEVIHHIKYKKRVRAKDQQEADDKAAALWIERDLKHIVDENVETMVFPVAYTPAAVTKRDGDA